MKEKTFKQNNLSYKTINIIGKCLFIMLFIIMIVNLIDSVYKLGFSLTVFIGSDNKYLVENNELIQIISSINNYDYSYTKELLQKDFTTCSFIKEIGMITVSNILLSLLSIIIFYKGFFLLNDNKNETELFKKKNLPVLKTIKHLILIILILSIVLIPSSYNIYLLLIYLLFEVLIYLFIKTNK